MYSIERSHEPTIHSFFPVLRKLVNQKELTDRDRAVIYAADQVFKATHIVPPGREETFGTYEKMLDQLKERANFNSCERLSFRLIFITLCSSTASLIWAIVNNRPEDS